MVDLGVGVVLFVMGCVDVVGIVVDVDMVCVDMGIVVYCVVIRVVVVMVFC